LSVCQCLKNVDITGSKVETTDSMNS